MIFPGLLCSNLYIGPQTDLTDIDTQYLSWNFKHRPSDRCKAKTISIGQWFTQVYPQVYIADAIMVEIAAEQHV